MTREPLIVEVPTLLQRVRAAGVLSTDVTAEPYLKWVGSKQHLIENHAGLLPDPKDVQHVDVPFVGGGSVALHYASAGMRVTCSDTCEPLITTHLAVQRSTEVLIAALDAIERQGYSAETYYDVRDRLNVHKGAPDVQRAAWFITIIKWGFNGLYRVNKKGECNTPFGKPSGKSPPRLYDEKNLHACSAAFQQCQFVQLDFEPHVEAVIAQQNGLSTSRFVYLDSPYARAKKKTGKTGNFTAYSADDFGPRDQERLAALLPRLDAAGVRWALSNSDVPLSRELFEAPAAAHGWNVTRIQRNGSMNSKTSARGKVAEILVRNYTNPGEAA